MLENRPEALNMALQLRDYEILKNFDDNLLEKPRTACTGTSQKEGTHTGSGAGNSEDLSPDGQALVENVAALIHRWESGREDEIFGDSVGTREFAQHLINLISGALYRGQN